MPRYSARRGSYRRRYSSRRRRFARLYSRYPRLTRGVRYVNARDSSVCNVKIVTTQFKPLYLPPSTSISRVGFVSAFSSNEPIPANKMERCSLLASPLYRLYSTIYDEVRIRGVQYQLTFVKPTSIAGNITTANVYTMMDRRFGNGEQIRIPFNLRTGATSAPVTFTDYRVPIIRRYYAARDIIERVQYHDCTMDNRDNYQYDMAYENMALNPNFFSPCFQFCIGFPITFAQGLNIDVNVRTVYYVTFRNPKGLNDDFIITNPDDQDERPTNPTRIVPEVPGEVPPEVLDEVPPEVSYESVVT